MVSYVLNDYASVSISDETRHRILNAIATLHYQPNRTARSLRTSKTFTITAIIPDVTNPFYPAFVRGIQDVADQHGYDVITFNTDGRAEKEEQGILSILEGHVDGVISVLFHLNARALFPLLDQNSPVVRLEATRKTAGERPLDNIYLDNVVAATTAVNYLIDKGHHHIGMLAGEQGPTHYRVMGYRQALESAGIPGQPRHIQRGDLNEQGGYLAMQAMLRLRPRPTAVFAANDLMAMGAYLAIKAAGLRIPQDIAVVGFDDIPTAKLVSPALTTIAQFQQEVGQRAAEMLFERLNDTAPAGGRSEERRHELIVRESA
jgi:LacI family transcriptional regulator